MRQSAIVLVVALLGFVLVASRDKLPPSLSISAVHDSSAASLEKAEDDAVITFELAIRGDGYFQVQDADGRFTYTRDGRFHTNEWGGLVDSAGRLLELPIAIPHDALHVAVDKSGYVTVVTASNPRQLVIVGIIYLAIFPHPEALKSTDRQMHTATAASGSPRMVEPGTLGSGTLSKRSVELNQGWIDRIATFPHVAPVDTVPLELPMVPDDAFEAPAAYEAPVPLEASSHVDEVPAVRTFYGFGLVAGLDGHGGRSPATQQAITKLLTSLKTMTNGSDVPIENLIPSGSVSMVMVTATIPTLTERGKRVDVQVSVADDCTSLEGGTLLITPLRGPDGEIYAVATGEVVLGQDAQGKFKLTTARIPSGAKVVRTITR